MFGIEKLLDFGKKNSDLENILVSLNANASNNYKDAAQDNYRELLELFEELKKAGKLKAKQIAYYQEILDFWAPQMKNYTHFDQKAEWDK
ncbi:MAG: hypothetical protein KBT01_03770 [Clostridiales bacterium]|nr:hypothetical protein [Candidatus Blautia equi]